VRITGRAPADAVAIVLILGTIIKELPASTPHNLEDQVVSLSFVMKPVVKV
jgi:hypothetical protein